MHRLFQSLHSFTSADEFFIHTTGIACTEIRKKIFIMSVKVWEVANMSLLSRMEGDSNVSSLSFQKLGPESPSGYWQEGRLCLCFENALKFLNVMIVFWLDFKMCKIV